MKNEEKTKDINNSYSRKISDVSTQKGTKGITLIALVITIIVLLILARSNNCNANRAEWNIE